jgi:hypothetical protein
MSLLNKIAISNGNKLRKAAANLTISAIDGKKVADWNRSLQDTIYQKRRLRAIPGNPNIRKSGLEVVVIRYPLRTEVR